MKHYVNELDPKSYVICKVCGKKFTRITGTHLKKHKMSPTEYKLKYKISKTEYISENICNSVGCTRESMIEKYGEIEGINRWEKYRTAQAYSNSFEYKQKKHNWTKEQFDEYNKNRAATLKNLILRHGDKIGKQKWDDYCNKQKYVGSSEDYFIEKYGLFEGRKKWKEICKKKALTLENFILKYGEINGKEKYIEYQQNRKKTNFYSPISQELFNNIIMILTNKEHIYFQDLNDKEYGVYLKTQKKYTFIDYYDLNKNKAIEFYGDYWHCNPTIYTEQFVHPTIKKSAKEIRQIDNERLNALKQEYKMDILVIWESEYLKNKELIIEKCQKFLEYK
jgi:hypothetical protein